MKFHDLISKLRERLVSAEIDPNPAHFPYVTLETIELRMLLEAVDPELDEHRHLVKAVHTLEAH